MLSPDYLEYIIKKKKEEDDFLIQEEKRIQLEIPEYYQEDDLESNKENVEPRRVIIIDL
tara:strand:+ start:355 stop:531 length:177 start_codon:yes stop_codon:yes gene_type:complete